MKIKTLFSSLLVTAIFSGQVYADAKAFLARDTPISKKRTLDLCVEFSTLATEKEKKEYLDELELRMQLSERDLNNLKTGVVENSMTMCGMYMVKGKPLAEQSRQIRPMTFKVVHVYEDHYFVTQSGMVVGNYERKEGVMPPSLSVEKPAVMPPPVMPH